MGPKRPNEPIEPYLDPLKFYNHGDNPALKNFMKIAMENSKNGGVIDMRTFAFDKGQRFFMARNWDDFLQRDLRAITFTRAFAVFILNTAFCFFACRLGRNLLPVGRYGIKTLTQTPFYQNFGNIGLAGVAGLVFTGLYTEYKTIKFTVHKFYRHVLMGERNWFLQEFRNTQRDGQYGFSDNPLGNQDMFPKSTAEKFILTNGKKSPQNYKGPYSVVPPVFIWGQKTIYPKQESSEQQKKQ